MKEESVSAEDIQKMLDKHIADKGGLIAILEEIQTRYGYLPETALRIVSEKTGWSLVDVYGVATFYRSFSLTPRGKHLICACLGTACHVRGAPRIVDELERQLGIKAGETTLDKEFTLEMVNCLGACALGPVVVIDGRYFSKVSKSKVKQLLDGALSGLDRIKIEEDKRIFPITVSCPRCNHSLMDENAIIDGYPSIRVTASFSRKHSSLRLSSLYGSHNILTEQDIAPGTTVDFICPHCHERMTGDWECAECGAPLANMIVHGGGTVQVCTRRGCKGHMLELV
ncbi:MAG: NAD(P)H-dependent oxidoreductase subunit E [Victivallales bacterium]